MAFVRAGCRAWRRVIPRRQHQSLRLLPVVLVSSGLVVAELARVDAAEVDYAGVVREPVHDRVGSDTVRERFDPVARTGLRSDHRRETVFPVREDGEQVARGVVIDADGEKVIDDEQIHVGELIEELLVGDAIAAGDDETAAEVIHPRTGQFSPGRSVPTSIAASSTSPARACT